MPRVRHIVRHNPERPPRLTLRGLRGVLPDKVINAALKTSARLTAQGIPHAFAGGIAVAAHGYARATKDIDLLLGEEAFERYGSLVMIRPSVPTQMDGVGIDAVDVEDDEVREHGLEAAEGDVPIIPLETLVYMKLKAGRMKDHADIVELVKAGAKVKGVVDLVPHEMRPKLLELIRVAESEE